jgi:hypothetical protein
VAARKSFLLRINAALWNDLSRWAAQEFRSVNGQIEYLLQRAIDERTGGKHAPEPEPEPERGEGEGRGTTQEDDSEAEP